MKNLIKTLRIEIFLKIKKLNTFTELMKEFNLSLSAISNNLITLEKEKLIYKRKEGREKYLYYTPKGFRFKEFLKEYEEFFEEEKENDKEEKK